MLRPFFDLAMQSRTRQLAFRRMVVGHMLLLFIMAWVLAASGNRESLITFAYLMLTVSMVEAAALIGWRLVQLPKSQALEFLLVSPVQPRRLFVAESLVGAARFLLIWCSGLPVFVLLQVTGAIDWVDLLPLMVLPAVWGLAAAWLLTAWVYEPKWVRRIGELFGLLGVLIYLTVGVLAGENLVIWLRHLPPALGQFLHDSVLFFHTMNPFGVVRYWFTPDAVDWIARERVIGFTLAGILFAGLALLRGAFRLKGHFHDRHYLPLQLDQESQRPPVGDHPLSWWAVKRVMEYSGRINLWLAGGFALMYAAYLIAGDDWPSWMGKLVFQIFETWGGAATVATALAVMAAVPAVFQFGLWDATTQDRCKRLELLLLTDLTAQDYWKASITAAWKRGRGYLFASAILWLALGISGRVTPLAVVASALSGGLLWYFSFAFGFRSFSSGKQTSGLASMLTLGLPLLIMGLYKVNCLPLVALIPAGLCHLPMTHGVSFMWLVGFVLWTCITIWLSRFGLSHCDRDLRAWYDANQGLKALE